MLSTDGSEDPEDYAPRPMSISRAAATNAFEDLCPRGPAPAHVVCAKILCSRDVEFGVGVEIDCGRADAILIVNDAATMCASGSALIGGRPCSTPYEARIFS